MILGGFRSSLGSLDAQLGAVPVAAAAVLNVSTLELTGSYQATVTFTGSSVSTIRLVGEVE